MSQKSLHPSGSFGEVLNQYFREASCSMGQLVRLTGISKSTIQSWLEGKVAKPHNRKHVILLAAALYRTLEETNQLLLAAHHRTTHLEEIQHWLKADLRLIERKQLSRLANQWKASSQTLATRSVPQFAPPFQMPPRLKHFTGREQLIKQCSQALLDKHAVCILQGLGGVGKSSLAVMLCYHLQSEFPDGILWADLDAIVDINHEQKLLEVIHGFAKAIGLDLGNLTDIGSASRTLQGVLASRKMLLVLNGAEDNASIQPLLPSTSGNCVVLITTRNRRLLNGEGLSFEVPPFDRAESIRFLQTTLGRERILQEATGVNLLLHFLEGHPLGLQIISAEILNTPGLTLIEFYENLQLERHRLELLEDWNDASKNIRATFALSFNRLSEANQKLFVSLSLFEGESFTAEAVAATNSVSIFSARRRLGKLYSLSLLEVEPHVHVRYRLHALLRLYAKEQVERLQFAAEQYSRRLHIFFLQLIQTSLVDELTSLETDWQNLKHAINWAIKHHALPHLLESIKVLTTPGFGSIGFLDIQGHWEAAYDWFSWLEQTIYPNTQTLERAVVLWKRGAFAFRLGRIEQAKIDLENALLLLNKLPTTKNVLLNFGYLKEFQARLYDSKDNEIALTHLHDGIDALKQVNTLEAQFQQGHLHIVKSTILGRLFGQFRLANDELQIAFKLLPNYPTPAELGARNNLVALLMRTRDIKSARSYTLEALETARHLGDQRRLATLHMNLGILEQRVGDLYAALKQHQIAEEIYTRIGQTKGVLGTFINQAMVYRIWCDYHKALECLRKAFSIAKQYDYERELAFVHVTHAQILIQMGDYDLAAHTLEAGIALARQQALGLVTVGAHVLHARLMFYNGDYKGAIKLAIESRQLAIEGEYVEEEGVALLIHAQASAALSNIDDAMSSFRKSVSQLAEQDMYEYALALSAYGVFLKEQNADQFQSVLEQALELFDQLGATCDIHHVELHLNP